MKPLRRILARNKPVLFLLDIRALLPQSTEKIVAVFLPLAAPTTEARGERLSMS
jgi:hypothetical protein